MELRRIGIFIVLIMAVLIIGNTYNNYFNTEINPNRPNIRQSSQELDNRAFDDSTYSFRMSESGTDNFFDSTVTVDDTTWTWIVPGFRMKSQTIVNFGNAGEIVYYVFSTSDTANTSYSTVGRIKGNGSQIAYTSHYSKDSIGLKASVASLEVDTKVE
jgi:hypothetical protein